jgi:hypothetical protein
LRHELAEFVDGIFDKGISELRVVLGGNDTDPHFGADVARTWWKNG